MEKKIAECLFEQLQCPICLEIPFSNQVQFLRFLPCLHKICSKCFHGFKGLNASVLLSESFSVQQARFKRVSFCCPTCVQFVIGITKDVESTDLLECQDIPCPYAFQTSSAQFKVLQCMWNGKIKDLEAHKEQCSAAPVNICHLCNSEYSTKESQTHGSNRCVTLCKNCQEYHLKERKEHECSKHLSETLDDDVSTTLSGKRKQIIDLTGDSISSSKSPRIQKRKKSKKANKKRKR